MSFLTIEAYSRYHRLRVLRKLLWLPVLLMAISIALAWVFVYNINQNPIAEAASIDWSNN